MRRRHLLAAAAASALSPVAAPAVRAQAFPGGPFRLIVPFGAGSATSVMMSSCTSDLRAYNPQPAVATAMSATAATAPQRKLLWRRGTAARAR